MLCVLPSAVYPIVPCFDLVNILRQSINISTNRVMIGNSNWTGCGPALPSPLCPHFCPLSPLVCAAPGTQTLLLFREHIQYTLAPGPLHLQCPLFLLPGMLCPTFSHGLFLYSLTSLLKIPVLVWPSLALFLQLQTSSILDSPIFLKRLTW